MRLWEFDSRTILDTNKTKLHFTIQYSMSSAYEIRSYSFFHFFNQFCDMITWAFLLSYRKLLVRLGILINQQAIIVFIRFFSREICFRIALINAGFRWYIMDKMDVNFKWFVWNCRNSNLKRNLFFMHWTANMTVSKCRIHFEFIYLRFHAFRYFCARCRNAQMKPQYHLASNLFSSIYQRSNWRECYKHCEIRNVIIDKCIEMALCAAFYSNQIENEINTFHHENILLCANILMRVKNLMRFSLECWKCSNLQWWEPL